MRRFALSCLACVLLAVPAGADHWRGIKATVQEVDNATLSVEISVTGYTARNGEEEAGEGPAPPFTQEYLDEFPTTPYGPSELYLPIGNPYETDRAAIAWGEGELLPTATLPAVAGGPMPTYRAAFSHTYEDVGPYTIRVTGCCAPTANYDDEEEEYYYLPGVPTEGPPTEGPPDGNEEIFTGNSTGEGSGFLTNTAQVVFGLPSSITEVPISRGGLFALAALLAVGALWLVRRG